MRIRFGIVAVTLEPESAAVVLEPGSLPPVAAARLPLRAPAIMLVLTLHAASIIIPVIRRFIDISAARQLLHRNGLGPPTSSTTVAWLRRYAVLHLPVARLYIRAMVVGSNIGTHGVPEWSAEDRTRSACRALVGRALPAMFLVTVACGYAPLEPLTGDATVGGDAQTPDAAPIITCTPNEFVDCVGNVARICNGEGNGSIDTDCGTPGCNMAAQRCNQCVPDELTCSNTELIHCGANGLPGTSETCAAGCSSTPSPHCTHIQPTYQALADVCDSMAGGTLDITTSQTLPTYTASVCNGGIVSQSSGPSICIVHYGTIRIASGVTVTVQGNDALALVADNALTIDGTLDLSASYTTNGPGGGTTMSGGAPSVANGGGGAGFKTAGGAGGNGTVNGGAANGGAAATDPATLNVLVGGTRAQTTVGGGGGGAAALISCQGTVLVSGTATLAAGGGGGSGNDRIMGPGVAAWGGGSGGNVVLQGMSVTVLGKVFANGGGGGGSTSLNGSFGGNGSDGLKSATMAASGGTSAGTGGAGGAGGIGNTPPAVGLLGADGTAGGGGGSVGFFQSFTPSGVTPTLTPTAASPAFQPNRTVEIK